MLPHVLDDVLAHAPADALRLLRATGRWMKRRIDSEQRHFRLILEDDTMAVGKTGKRTPTLRLKCHSVVGGVLQLDVPQSLDVLDIGALPSRMWYDYVEALEPCFAWSRGGEWQGWAYFGRGLWTEDWAREHSKWYEVHPRLVRYTDGLGIREPAYKDHHIRWDPCAVYFCDFVEFNILLWQMINHGREQEWCPPLTTVLNVTVDRECNPMNPILDEPVPSESEEARPPRNPLVYSWLFGGIHQFQGEIVLLLNVKPSYAALIKGKPPVFWMNLLYFFHDPTASRSCGSRYPKGHIGGITIVGYETWPVDMLPHPRRIPDGWHGGGWDTDSWVGETRRDDIPDEGWDGEYSIETRVQWWHKAWTDYIEVEPWHPPPKRVRLLTLAEWKAEVGGTYFKLMTDPKAEYRSTEPLPPFNDIVATYQQTVAENEQDRKRYGDHSYRRSLDLRDAALSHVVSEFGSTPI